LFTKACSDAVSFHLSLTRKIHLKTKKLAYALRTSPEFWLNAQVAVDIYKAERDLERRPAPIARKTA